MTQFILIAKDATDEAAYDRRIAAREEHLALITKLRGEGKIIFGIALTDDAGKMNGSLIVTNFDARDEFNNWLYNEPFMVNKVWGDITVLTGKLSPSFADLIK